MTALSFDHQSQTSGRRYRLTPVLNTRNATIKWYKMRLAKSSIIVFISSQFGTVFGFVATFYIASSLGPEVLGGYTVAVGMLYWMNLPASAVNSAVKKRVSEGTDRGEILSAGLLATMFITLPIVAGIVFFSPYIENYLKNPVSVETAILIIVWAISGLMSTCLAGQKKVASASIITTIGRMTRTIFQIVLTLLMGLGVAGLIWGHSISLLFATALALVINSVSLAWPSKEHFVSLYEYARYAWLGQISVQAFNWLDTVIMAFFVSSGLIGIYEAAWTMASALSLVSSSISTTLFPTLSELSTANRHNRISELLTEGIAFSGILIIPGLAGASAIGPRILEIYGPEYGQGGMILILLIIARFANGYNGLFKNTINAIDRPDVGFRINAVLVASNIVLNFSLIPLFGWYGAAIGTAGSAIIGLLFGYYWVNQSIPIRVPYQEIGFQFLASLIMILATFGLSQMLGPGRIETVVIVLISAGVYSGALLILSNTVRQKTISILSSHPYLRAILISRQ
jgi:O-antigen/teichoic acid export membrane protein